MPLYTHSRDNIMQFSSTVGGIEQMKLMSDKRRVKLEAFYKVYH